MPKSKKTKQNSKSAKGIKPTMRALASISFDIDYGPPASATAVVTPGTAEWVWAVSIFDDDGGNPGNWVGEMWFFGYSGGNEIWNAGEWDFDPEEPKDGEVYHAVAYATAEVTSSDSDDA